MDRWISALWTRRLIETGAKSGADADDLWRLVGLSPERASADARVSDETHLAVWEAIQGAIDDPAFPIVMARTMALDDYEALGLACKTARDVADGFARVTRFLSLWTNAVAFQLTADEPPRLVIDRPGPPTLGRRCSNESAVAELLGAITWMSGEPARPLSVHFRHTAPRSTAAHEDHFGSPLHFDSSFDGLEMDAEILRRPLPLADHGLSEFVLTHLEERAARTSSERTLVDEVAQSISEELPSGGAEIDAVAARLGVSVRTLQRRLAEADCKFQDIVTRTRQQLAERMLSQKEPSIAEIAFLLGFSEPSAFHRAFRRWTGKTPGTFRAERN